MTIVGLLLAGGESRRMGGGDKALCEVGGVLLIDHCLDRLRPQVDCVVLSVNSRNAWRFADCKVPIVPDAVGAGHGPLAGILAGLRWSAETCTADAVLVTVPTDTPFIPPDLVVHLSDALRRSGCEIAVAAHGGRMHYAVSAWRMGCSELLEHWLMEERSSSIRDFLKVRRTVAIEFAGCRDPFFNVNTPQDLRANRGQRQA